MKTRLTDTDLYLFNEGTHYRLYDKLGAHPGDRDGERGVWFAVWAPNARRVSVFGDFDGWSKKGHELAVRGGSGIWEGFVPGVETGSRYKYVVESSYGDHRGEKADPFAFSSEVRPGTASRVAEISGFAWGDADWMARRKEAQSPSAPISIYEMHLGSWRRATEEGGRWLGYREIAPRLVEWVREMGFTHVELMPITEHPFDGSWGYQTTGYFAATSRFGSPQDLMFLIDALHRAGIGVILDWVPAHFPTDGHGLGFFDGTHLYEHADPRKGFHPDWDTFIFNYARNEVRSFLLSSATFWLREFHIDGLRLDAVASMLYLDYSRKEGEWIPNEHGGRDNLEAIAFLKQLNEVVRSEAPDAITIAEESTAWPNVSRPIAEGGLGFDFKWDMGWMHDTLAYLGFDPIHRTYHHDKLTFRGLYAWSERFMLTLSHDEVVHGKSSLVNKMPGDEWQRFANMRLLHAWMHAQPGKKLLFMGGEFAQTKEWNHDAELDWPLLQWDLHRGMKDLVRDLNRLYREAPPLHELDCDPAGMEWIDCEDRKQSVVSLLRRGRNPAEAVLFVFNFTPVPRHNYRIGVPWIGTWEEVVNTDAKVYGGSGQGNQGSLEANPVAAHGRTQSVTLLLPPLSMIALRSRRPEAARRRAATDVAQPAAATQPSTRQAGSPPSLAIATPASKPAAKPRRRGPAKSVRRGGARRK